MLSWFRWFLWVVFFLQPFISAFICLFVYVKADLVPTSFKSNLLFKYLIISIITNMSDIPFPHVDIPNNIPISSTWRSDALSRSVTSGEGDNSSARTVSTSPSLRLDPLESRLFPGGGTASHPWLQTEACPHTSICHSDTPSSLLQIELVSI